MSHVTHVIWKEWLRWYPRHSTCVTWRICRYEISCHVRNKTHDSWLMTPVISCHMRRYDSWLMTPYEDMKGHDSWLLMRIWKDMTHASLWGYERTWLMTLYADMKGVLSHVAHVIWRGYQRSHDIKGGFEKSHDFVCPWLIHVHIGDRLKQHRHDVTHVMCGGCERRPTHGARWKESWVMWWMDMSHESCDEWSHESCDERTWVMSHVMNGCDEKSHESYLRICRQMAHLLRRLVVWAYRLCVFESSRVTHVNESCHTCEWVVSHMWMSRVTHVNESYHACEWVMSRILLVNASWLCCEWVVPLLWMSHDCEWVMPWHVNASWLRMSPDFVVWVVRLHTDDRFHWECYTPPKSTRSGKSSPSKQIQIKPKSLFEFEPRDTEKSELLDLVDFGGVAFSVEIVIGRFYILPMNACWLWYECVMTLRFESIATCTWIESCHP